MTIALALIKNSKILQYEHMNDVKIFNHPTNLNFSPPASLSDVKHSSTAIVVCWPRQWWSWWWRHTRRMSWEIYYGFSLLNLGNDLIQKKRESFHSGFHSTWRLNETHFKFSFFFFAVVDNTSLSLPDCTHIFLPIVCLLIIIIIITSAIHRHRCDRLPKILSK